MSYLTITLGERSAILVTDTQISDGNARAVAYASKVIHLPEWRMVATGTGDLRTNAVWMRSLTSDTGLDIDDLNAITPATLRHLRTWAEQNGGPLLTGYREYHVGFPRGSEAPILYMYDSDHDFEPERFEGPITWGQPLPRTFQAEAPITVADHIALAIRIRDDYAPGVTDEPCGIGGDLIGTLLTSERIQTGRWHTFEPTPGTLPRDPHAYPPSVGSK